MTSRVFVLGGTGNVGSAVVQALIEMGLEVVATTRAVQEAPVSVRSRFVEFDVERDDLEELLAGYGEGDFVVNCIGIIKPYIHDEDERERLRAVKINSCLPYDLARLAEAQNFRVIQIATDCVYAGSKGLYDENDPHDATDVYGKTKSLGEVPHPRFLNLRCSIIGPELKSRRSLLEWVLAHETGSTFTGFTDHLWNGVTTRAFGHIAGGIILTGNDIYGTFHVVPSQVVTKYELSKMILRAYERREVTVVPTETGVPIDRSLSTLYPEVNARLWADAGYPSIPSVEQLVDGLVTTRIANGE